MKTVSLASGSKGNCIFIEALNVRLLVDVGLTCSMLEERLKLLNIDPKSINAILITHEHTDHVCGVGAFARKYKTKVYVHTSGFPHTIKCLGKLAANQIIAYAGNTFFIDNIQVSAVPVQHDSGFCVGYSFIAGANKVSVVTDIGSMSQTVLGSLSGSDILYLEANHDEELLMNNDRYSALLKRRILSSRGHLSNKACANALATLVPTGVKQVILSHLSEENNSPSIAYNTVKSILEYHGIIEGENVFVDVATQHKIGTVFEIKDN